MRKLAGIASSVIVAGASGCIGSGSSGSPGDIREPVPANCGEATRGDPSQLTTPIGATDGPAIAAPVSCDEGDRGLGGYIRVLGHGQRRIEMGRDALARCTEPPATPTGCVFSDDFGRAVIARLGAQGIQTIGLGLGVCGDIRAGYDGWNMSVSVHDWKHADAAIAAVDAELRARDVGHFFGVSVRGIPCAVAE